MHSNTHVVICPMCLQDARGDQCDNCGALMNPTELINPKCKITGTTPVIRSTKHLFLDLPKLNDQLQEYITDTSQLVRGPHCMRGQFL